LKKMVAFLTAMMLLAVALVGCGGGAASSANSPPPATSPGAAAPSPAKESASASEPAPATVQPGALRVGMVTPDADHGFTGESVAHAKAELEALKASGRIAEFKYEVGGEAALQIAAIETILQWGPDVIILWPLEGEQLRNAAQTIVDKGVKLIIYDRLIDGFRSNGEIMGDNETIGEMTGNYLINYFEDELKAGEKLTYLRFIGDSSTVSVQRSGGMDSVIDASPYKDQFEQVQQDYQTDWSNAKAQEQMENWLNTAGKEKIEELDIIVTHDDEVVDGIVVALQNYHNSNPSAQLNLKLITGVGGRRETLSTFDSPVANGIDLVTYFFSPSFIREAIRLGVAAGYGEQYDNQNIEGQLFLIPTIEIDKNTVADFRNSTEFKERYSI
jgi:ribose transport system substrate-binding protein